MHNEESKPLIYHPQSHLCIVQNKSILITYDSKSRFVIGDANHSGTSLFNIDHAEINTEITDSLQLPDIYFW